MAGWNYNEAAFHSVVDGEINALTEKETPADADLIVIEDSEDGHAKKKVEIGNLPVGTGSGVDVEDDDSSVATADTLNFGTGLAVTDDGAGKVTINATGGGGGGGPVVVRKASAQSVTSSTTLVNDDDLTFEVDANDVWVVNYYLYVDGATGGDIKATVVGPSGSTGRSSLIGTGTSGTTYENTNFNNQSNPLGTAPPAGTLGAGNVNVVHVAASVVVGETSGSIVLQWAQQASSGTPTRVLDGSYLVAHKVS